MQQKAQVLVAVVLVVSLAVATTDAKRGCLKYGHSCLGGHGKRSELPLRHDEQQPRDVSEFQNFFGDCKDELMQDIPNCIPKPALNTNKLLKISQEIAYPTNNHLGPNSKDIAQALTEQRKMQFAFYNLVRQMMNNARKAHDSSTEMRGDDLQQLV